MKGELYINGKWLSGKNTFDSINPETEEVIGSAVEASKHDVNEAVIAAQNALEAWKNKGVEERAKIIDKAAELLSKEYGEIGEPTYLKKLINKEIGKRIPESDVEVMESSDMIRFFSKHGSRCLSDRPIALNSELWPTKQSYITFEPIGVIGIIKPWNYPLELPLWSITPALIAGNTVIFKPSEKSPFIGIEIVKLFEKAGLPPGVLNLLTGDGKVGKMLVEDDRIDMISFTGSREVGKWIGETCGKFLKRVSLELGGKDCMIMLKDADIELATNGALWGSFTNCGQVCVGIERIIAHKDIYDEFIKRLTQKTSEIVLGRDVGPLVSKKQLLKVESHVNDAIKKGATILIGGDKPDNLDRGFFFNPTILTNTNGDMLVEKEETFGPVVTIRSFDKIEEAISYANSTKYDLGASIWTQNTSNALNVSRKIKSGMVWVNDVNVAFPEAPWGGLKGSGHGIELSEFSFYEYSVIRHINYETGTEKRREWWFPYSQSNDIK